MDDQPFSGPQKLDSSFFPFSSPSTFHQLDNNGFNNDIFIPPNDDQFVPPNDASNEKTITMPRRKRATGKDRHSKICTALGMRNRRMRLSLDVAPDFFDIQDMLGFDKASKTLRWLITMAEPAIRDLIAVTRGGDSSKSNESSTSGLDLESGDMISTKATSACLITESPKAKRRRPPPSRRPAPFPATVTRELRIKARERARERTEKKRLLQSSLDHLLNHHDAVDPFEAMAKVEEECSRSPNQHRQLAAIFDYNQSTICLNDTVYNIFHQHWDMEDVQLIQSRLWEA